MFQRSDALQKRRSRPAGAPGGLFRVLARGPCGAPSLARRGQLTATVRFFWAAWIGPGKITLLTVWSPVPSE